MQEMLDGTDLESLPLFSGTPMQANGSASDSKAGTGYVQSSFGKCKVCRDTGMVGKKYCWCEAGVAARKMRGG